MKRILQFLTLLAFTAVTLATVAGAHPNSLAQAKDPKDGWDLPEKVDPKNRKPLVEDDGKPVIQVAILLDTSGSMSGLIDQAKAELWSIVNALGDARYKGQIPRLEVALYEYGKSSLSPQQGYIRQLSPLTGDLDGLSETLFSLETNGGQEYCAWVIRSALDGLYWKERKGSLRLVFVAGNESFYQGPVDFDSVLARANKKGVLIHPIYCNNGNENDQLTWSQAARLARTELKIIDHNKVVIDPTSPYDEEIQQLGRKLNTTYIPYGDRRKRAEYSSRQEAQDTNSAAAGAATNRSVAKASPAYSNAEWDLVDAEKDGRLEAGKLDDEKLPEEMKGMSTAEREAYVKKKAGERQAIQDKIRSLESKRQAFLAEKRKEANAPASLGKAVIDAIANEAPESGFEMK